MRLLFSESDKTGLIQRDNLFENIVKLIFTIFSIFWEIKLNSTRKNR